MPAVLWKAKDYPAMLGPGYKIKFLVVRKISCEYLFLTDIIYDLQ